MGVKEGWDHPHTFILVGASGDLAKKKMYPTIWYLYRDSLLPPNTKFIGYARTKQTITDVKNKCKQYMKLKPGEEAKFEEFWKNNDYIAGSYGKQEDFENLNKVISKFEKGVLGNRIFYLAVPPTVFENVTVNVKNSCTSTNGFTRVIIEKPFGKDSESCEKLSKHLNKLFKEEEIYRIDHYLGKEMVQNLLAFRFANSLFNPTWNRDNIASVLISFAEPFGTEGRGGYFDDFGIIRDIQQNHLLQILCLIAMERPVTLDPNDIRDEKVKVLKHIKPIELEDILLGQYVGNPNGKGDERIGYLDDPTVPKDSITPTYALTTLRIKNTRWDGVPFLLSSGKALNERKVEIRIQYKEVAGDIFDGKTKRNELILKVQPEEKISFKFMNKLPGIKFELDQTELDLTYNMRFRDTIIPEAYERLVNDAFTGSQMYFVRDDELREAWRIFTPILKKIENERVKPLPYVYGSKGPEKVEKILAKHNFVL